MFSYSLYLTHRVVLQEADTITTALCLSPLNALAFRAFVSIPAALGLAYAFHKVAEKPFMTPFQKQNEDTPASPPRGD